MMPIDFFCRKICQKNKGGKEVCTIKDRCQTSIAKEYFGLRDTTGNTPAFIDLDNPKEWLATVENPDERCLQFYAIDHCLHLHDEQGNAESSCDCMIAYKSTKVGNPQKVIFIELKDRSGKSKKNIYINGKEKPIEEWLKVGFDQIFNTIKLFHQSHSEISFSKIRGYACNKQEKDLPGVIDRTDISNEFFERTKELNEIDEKEKKEKKEKKGVVFRAKREILIK